MRFVTLVCFSSSPPIRCAKMTGDRGGMARPQPEPQLRARTGRPPKGRTRHFCELHPHAPQLFLQRMKDRMPAITAIQILTFIGMTVALICTWAWVTRRTMCTRQAKANIPDSQLKQQHLHFLPIMAVPSLMSAGLTEAPKRRRQVRRAN